MLGNLTGLLEVPEGRRVRSRREGGSVFNRSQRKKRLCEVGGREKRLLPQGEAASPGPGVRV